MLVAGMGLVCPLRWPGHAGPGNPRPESTIKHLEIALCSQSARVVRRHYWSITRPSLPSPSVFLRRRPRSAFNYGIGSELDNALYPQRMNSRSGGAWRCRGDGEGFRGNDSGGAGDNGEGLRG
ncbi:hypothetical protein E2C01_093852 [Portunus trituberculatus]|uniref:Uncharacterized protein n=1 Tax=Portunus trituberculatus TaxID=210409 RepID=A0A5B7JUL0_PORTR|nr:hypothetical protein [Portunus trituberculatus]